MSIQADDKATVGRWEGGGTHTGPAFGDFPIGALRQLGLIVAAQA